MIKNFDRSRYQFSIFRILGNEMPPRDEPDARLKTLKFILDNEPDFDGSLKCWLLNTIHDRKRREQICEMLASRNHYFIVLPMDRQAFDSALDRDSKIIHAIAINKARNICIKHGKTLSKFSVLLDGDCFFTQKLWDRFRNQLFDDQRVCKNRRHYSIPCSRSTMEHSLSSDEPMLLAEPMPVFRYDADIYFDETRPFGKGDKLELLFRLNHSKEFGKNYLLENESLCKSVGMVHHVTASDYEIETNFQLRNKLRNQSIDMLLSKVTQPEQHWPEYYLRAHKKPNEFWKSVQGYFDFRGLYSHFAWELPHDAKFVEVGTWLGASAFYLAQEFVNRGKRASVVCVDTWLGSPEKEHIDRISKMGGKDSLYHAFIQNLSRSGLGEVIKPIRMKSTEASSMFEDNSLDAVFIDANHSYEAVLDDLASWFPKVKPGGKIAGHDYLPGNKASESGVIPAVQKFFYGKNLETSPAGRTWLHRK